MSHSVQKQRNPLPRLGSSRDLPTYVDLDRHRCVAVQELTMLRSQLGSEIIFLRFWGAGQMIATLTLHSLLQIPAWIQRSSDTSSGLMRNRDSHNKSFLQKKFILLTCACNHATF